MKVQTKIVLLLGLLLVIFINNRYADSLRDAPLPRAALEKLLSSREVAHFFVTTPKGWMELRGGTIHPSRDRFRETAPQGYFLAGRFWIDENIRRMSAFTGYSIRVVPVEKAATEPESAEEHGLITFRRTFPGWDGRPVAEIQVESDSPIIREFNRSQHHLFIGLIEQRTHGSETILVVEDEGVVRQLICTVLGEAGYNVICAESAEAELQLAPDRKESIHLLVTDIVMPGMNGPALARALSEHQPSLKISTSPDIRTTTSARTACSIRDWWCCRNRLLSKLSAIKCGSFSIAISPSHRFIRRMGVGLAKCDRGRCPRNFSFLLFTLSFLLPL